MWNLRKTGAAVAFLAVTALGACDFNDDGVTGMTPPDEATPRFAAMDSTFASDTSRTFVQVERHANPLAMEVLVAKREHGAHDALPPFRDPGLFTDDFIEFITKVAGRPQFLAETVASVLLGQIGTNEGDKLTIYPKRAPGVTAVNAGESSLVGWLTYVLAPGQGYGGRKLSNDDVVDKAAGIVFGTTITSEGVVSPGLVTDNVDRNDGTPLNTFPYFPVPNAAPSMQPQPTRTFFTVRVENLSTSSTLNTGQGTVAIPLSPGAFAVFTGRNPLFVPGTRADAGTENIAEDGFPQVKVQDVANSVNANGDTVRFFGTFNAFSGSPAIEPGQVAEFGIQALPGDRLSFQTMFVQSNDLFYAFGGNGVALFDGNGNPISGDLTAQVVLWDAGTEVDQPLGLGDAQKPRQPHPNFGAGENDVIRTAQDGTTYTNIPPTAQVIRVTIRVGAPTGSPQPQLFATAYINPDAGQPTANASVNANSSCANPDREDTQQVSAAGSTANNVRVDACLSTQANGAGTPLDQTASFEVSGVGVISACPDPDGSGPKTATLVGNRCTLTGFEAANSEYHLRVNSTTPGTQLVVFCSDPERDGCGNSSARSQQIVVNWVQ